MVTMSTSPAKETLAMNSRERVKRTIDCNRPDRAPRDLWHLPGVRMRLGDATVNSFMARWPGDITQATGRKNKAIKSYGDLYAVGAACDEWGCVFENATAGIHGEVKNPILADWDFDKLHVPNELLDVDLEKVTAFAKNSDKYVFASGWARPFERIQFIRGTENIYMDLAMESPELTKLIKIVHDFYLKDMQTWVKTPVDAVVIMDDWGMQRSLLISPDMWRKVFKPLYKDYCDLAHSHGKQVWMHSDGYIYDIIPDLIEVGVNVLNSQLFCMPIEEIGKKYKGKICFWGEIDRQHILPFGTPKDVEQAVERVHANLWNNGGCLAQFEWTAETPLANAEAVYNTWDRLTKTV
jgi:hypothetical protein